MTRTVSFVVVSFRASLPACPVPASEARLLLTDSEWCVVFRHPQLGVRCGLLRSRIDVVPVTRHRCRVTVHDRGTDEFRGAFVVRARARRVQAAIDRRMTALDLAAEVTASVGDGQWWRDARRFHDLGWARMASVAGVTCPGGTWGTVTVPRTRVTKVLDVGPGGVTLRGWRKLAVLPWETVEDMEVAADPDPSTPGGAGRAVPGGHPAGGTIVRLRSRSGDVLVFHTRSSTTADIAARLRPFQDLLVPS